MALPLKKRRTPEEIQAAWDGAKGENIDLFVYGTMMSSRHVKLLLNRGCGKRTVHAAQLPENRSARSIFFHCQTKWNHGARAASEESFSR